jgi:protoporphyrinogen oxidase
MPPYLDNVIEQMDNIGWINRDDVHNHWVLRIPYAYPVYHIGYEKELAAVKEYLSQWQNLHLVGRTGSFCYMNSDGVIENVFRLIEELFSEENSVIKALAIQTGRWI